MDLSLLPLTVMEMVTDTTEGGMEVKGGKGQVMMEEEGEILLSVFSICVMMRKHMLLGSRCTHSEGMQRLTIGVYRGGDNHVENVGTNLHVSGLALRVEPRDLEDLFGKYGQVSPQPIDFTYKSLQFNLPLY